MKKLLLVGAFVLLSGCATTVPVTMSFPQAPEDLKVACPNLKQTQPTTKLSDVVTVVTDNYANTKNAKLK
jgi:hypothetical protein